MVAYRNTEQSYIVGWDPRGVHKSQPKALCFNTAPEEQEFWARADKVFRPGLEAPGDLSDQSMEKFLELAQPADEVLLELGANCAQVQQQSHTLSYIGTVATVKDMIAIHEANGGTKKVNFWGFL
ncbi:hypothetical protein RSOLAG1IB_10341 [Rhizoctonia solani AG-1 IB]|uniref:Uncharacterized protein n=1 Tax=Thanatephorus cucumeris (strain AG1-IB / isolate 7/3/14) TaxID=1108050 RepID=A0A0B7G1E6_THACB|nr:hypothetical protein RSOLAG1IB_10341 [Rhizoctonia solani AG-1 IB]